MQNQSGTGGRGAGGVWLASSMSAVTWLVAALALTNTNPITVIGAVAPGVTMSEATASGWAADAATRSGSVPCSHGQGSG
jgi:hypothetical protein